MVRRTKIMIPRSLLHVLTIASVVLASPLNLDRRQLVVTITVTTTSTAAASSSQPIVPIIPTAILPYTTTGTPSDIVTASPVSSSAIFTPISHPPVPIIDQSLSGTIVEPFTSSSAPTSTGLPAEDPCQVVCKADKISIATCLQNCQVIDGNAQLNAPGKVFPPEIPTTLATSTTSSSSSSSSSSPATFSTLSVPTYRAPVAPVSTDTTTDGFSDEEDGSPSTLPLPNMVTEEQMEEVAILCQKLCRHQSEYITCIGKCEIERLSAR